MFTPIYMRDGLDWNKQFKARHRVKKLSQKKLAKVAKEAPDKAIRKEAVENLTDQALLADIAKNDSDCFVRKAAVERLTDQVVLAEIAKNDSEWRVRKAAFEMMNDEQSALAEAAKNAYFESDRIEAVKKLTDQAVLAEVAKKDSDREVRIEAVKKLTDQAVLAEVAKKDSDREVRKAAVKKLTDQALLAKVAKQAQYDDICEAAVEKLTDKDVLAKLVKDAPSWGARLVAVEKLYGKNEMWAEKAKSSYDTYAGKEAVDRLTDQAALADVARNAVNVSVRIYAAEKYMRQFILSTDDKSIDIEDVIKDICSDTDLLKGLSEEQFEMVLCSLMSGNTNSKWTISAVTANNLIQLYRNGFRNELIQSYGQRIVTSVSEKWRHTHADGGSCYHSDRYCESIVHQHYLNEDL